MNDQNKPQVFHISSNGDFWNGKEHVNRYGNRIGHVHFNRTPVIYIAECWEQKVESVFGIYCQEDIDAIRAMLDECEKQLNGETKPD